MSEKIQSIGAIEEWQGSHGKMYSIEITLENGKTGKVNAKTPDRWKIGDEIIILEEKDSMHGLKWKFDKPGYDGQGSKGGSRNDPDRQITIDASWAISKALEAGFRGEAEIIEGAKTALRMRNELISQMKAKAAEESSEPPIMDSGKVPF